MTRLAQLIAAEEGFGLAGKAPTIRHNPGDLRHSPHSSHPGPPNAVGTIDTDSHGWEDLERQLRMYADRGLTLGEAIRIFAPANENNTDKYLRDVCAGLGMSDSTPMSQVLEVKV